MPADSYYFEQLDKEKRRIYRDILEGLLAAEPRFRVPLADTRTLSEIFSFVRLDHPEIFYAVSFSYNYVRGADYAEIVPEYLFKKAQIQEHAKAIAARTKRLLQSAADRDDAGKIISFHDLLVTSVHYDKLKKPYSHEIIGPLTQGVGVCEGIAKSFKLLCDAAGLWCIVVISENAPEKGIKYRHAWNMVRLDGKYYHVDATFDTTLSAPGTLRGDYLLLSDSFLFRDHEPSIYAVPACTDSRRGFYQQKGLAFTDMEKLEKRAQQAARKGKDFVFQWRGGIFTREILRETVELFSSQAEARGLSACFFVNMPQGVVRVSFEKGSAGSSVNEENANEGEQYCEG